MNIFVPCDAAALSVGADETARAITAEAERRGVAVALKRNGSRGLLWLEPLVEVDVGGTRLAYGPVQPEDVAGLFEAGFTAGGAHPLSLGCTAEIPYLKRQERLTFARVGLTDPRSSRLGVDESVMWGDFFFLEAVDKVLRRGRAERSKAAIPI